MIVHDETYHGANANDQPGTRLNIQPYLISDINKSAKFS